MFNFLRFIELLHGESGVKEYPGDHMCVCVRDSLLQELISRYLKGRPNMVILNLIQHSPNYQTTLEFPISLKHRLSAITMTPLFVIMVN